MTFEEWKDSRVTQEDMPQLWGMPVVIADERAAWDAATLAERERCAKLVEDEIGWDWETMESTVRNSADQPLAVIDTIETAKAIAKAIRSK